MKQLWRKHITYAVPLLLTTVVLCVFVSRKEGYHMDELLSFQLSNAEYNPWIVPRQPEGRLAKFIHNEIDGDSLKETLGNLTDVAGDVLKNRGNSLLLSYKADVYEEPVWISGEQFVDYITVDSSDDFNYLSVYFNVKDDNHPPFHFMLLHTISSLWKGKAEPFMGCVINIAAVLGICLLMVRIGSLFALGNEMNKRQSMDKGQCWEGRKAGVAAALLYGLSSGAIATTLLVRMYGVMTFFCVALFYFHIKKWQEKGFADKNKLLIAVTVLGFWTQYFFLFYCISLAAVTTVLLWREKRKMELARYVRSMAAAALLGVAVFPFAISDVFSSGRGVEALENLTGGFGEYGTRLIAFGGILLTRMFGSLQNGIITGAVLLVLAAAGAIIYGKTAGGEKPPAVEPVTESKERGGKSAFLLMLLVPPVCYFLLAAKMSPYLVDRYIMPVFPFAMMSLAFLVVRGVELVKGWKAGISRKPGIPRKLLPDLAGSILTGVILIGICAGNVFAYDGEYLYKGYASQKQAAEEYAGLPCLCIYDGYGFYENLLEFAYYDKTLLLKTEELEMRQETVSLQELTQVVVLTKRNVEDGHVRELLAEQYGLIPVKELITDSVYGDRMWLFEKQM